MKPPAQILDALKAVKLPRLTVEPKPRVVVALTPEDQRRAQEMLVTAARAHGRRFTRSRPAHPSNMGAVGECWTNAWNLSRQIGRPYFEGLVQLQNGQVVPHAWTLDRKGRVIESTPGYAGVQLYQGFEVGRGLVLELTASWTGWRSSVLECLASAGYDQRDRRSADLFTKLTGVRFKI